MWRLRKPKWMVTVLGFWLLTAAVPAAALAATSFQYSDAVAEAELLAQNAFETPKKIPEMLLKISYEQWRSIRFKPESALWRAHDLPFEVQFFHPGWVYNRIVSIHIVEPEGVKPVSFSPDLFHYGMNDSKVKNQIPADLGFAGFRLHYPGNAGEGSREAVAFLGASYFRAAGSKQHFGLSARGLAIDTALEGGEEFPYFRKFWLVRPQKSGEAITIYALLDSASLTGALEFKIQPGNQIRIDTASTLFLRKEVKKLGMAPLNSMFFYGENTNIRPVDDFHPEVHDSDGLQIATDTGEWIWRPLINPKKLLVTSFQVKNPKGFGLIQRDLNFNNYQDLEADYHRRPSVWITPGSDWGEGRIELVQIPTESEKNDNIVCYWVPAGTFKPGAPVSFSYGMQWNGPDMADTPFGRVVATRTAVDKKQGVKMYLIDFAGGKLRHLPEDAKVVADIGVGGADLLEYHLRKNEAIKGYRLVFQVKRKEGPLDLVMPGNGPLELRAFLRQEDEVLTQTWSYVDP